MKPLDDYKSGNLRSTLMLNLCFGGGGFPEPKLDSWLVVFVRMVELASDEYQTAAHYCSLHGQRVGHGVTISLPEACDHLELCVLCVRRALRCLGRLAAAPEGYVIDRPTKRRIKNVEKALSHVRDAIEHIDEKVREGLGDGQPHTLAIASDGRSASIAGQSLDIGDLHRSLKLLRGIATTLASYRAPSASDQPS